MADLVLLVLTGGLFGLLAALVRGLTHLRHLLTEPARGYRLEP